jgi:hypothetical protein
MEGEGGGTATPFFPSSAETNVGGVIPSKFFMTANECARCHKEIYDQWNASAHHFGSFNNQWYRKSIEYMQDVIGTKPSKWCAGCHDHAVFFNGRFDKPIREQIETKRAQLHLVSFHCSRQEHDGAGGLHHRVSPLARCSSERQQIHQVGSRLPPVPRPPASPRNFPEEFSYRTDGGVLFELSQSAPGRSGKQLSLVSGVQRVRQLAGVGRLGSRRAIVLLPA